MYMICSDIFILFKESFNLCMKRHFKVYHSDSRYHHSGKVKSLGYNEHMNGQYKMFCIDGVVLLLSDIVKFNELRLLSL